MPALCTACCAPSRATASSPKRSRACSATPRCQSCCAGRTGAPPRTCSAASGTGPSASWTRREKRASRAREWHDGDVVVDVGGGNGTLLVELLRRRPELRGIVVDLPETDRDESLFGDAIEFVAGSFFDEVPAGDVYVLSEILHNWPDERAAAILRAIRAGAPPHARLLILDSVVHAGNDPHSAKWLDLLMLALFASRERDEAQWNVLLAATGWEPTRIEDGLIEAVCR